MERDDQNRTGEDSAAMNSENEKPKEESDQLDLPRVMKRRQSSSPGSSSKRTRLSIDRDLDLAPTIGTSQNPSPPVVDSVIHPPKDLGRAREESNVQEERKRGRRLFGGLLNTLSQSASDAQQKKRLEIEKRQQEKARLQKAEDDLKMAERIRKIKKIRMLGQVKFDEQSMRLRHMNVLAMAHFLCTNAEPKLYYKPWKLLPGQADRIKQQISDTEVLIQGEVQSSTGRYEQEELGEEGSHRSWEVEGKDADAGGAVHDDALLISPNPEPVSDSRLLIVRAEASESAQGQVRPEGDALEENGEVVIEGDEDTVIY